MDTHAWYNKQFQKSGLPFCSLQYLSEPWIVDTQLLYITYSFHGPNCVQTVLNDTNLADNYGIFQRDCPRLKLDMLDKRLSLLLVVLAFAYPYLALYSKGKL